MRYDLIVVASSYHMARHFATIKRADGYRDYKYLLDPDMLLGFANTWKVPVYLLEGYQSNPLIDTHFMKRLSLLERAGKITIEYVPETVLF